MIETKAAQKKILIGGRALVNLGSSRATEDTDYLVSDESAALFVHDEENGIDYINAAKSDFFGEIYAIEEGNAQASPQSLLELKAYAFVQHCENFNFEKADQAEFDIKFLARKFDLTSAPIAGKYISQGAQNELRKILKIRR